MGSISRMASSDGRLLPVSIDDNCGPAEMTRDDFCYSQQEGRSISLGDHLSRGIQKMYAPEEVPAPVALRSKRR